VDWELLWTDVLIELMCACERFSELGVSAVCVCVCVSEWRSNNQQVKTSA
jgi:hypothetical protein